MSQHSPARKVFPFSSIYMKKSSTIEVLEGEAKTLQYPARFIPQLARLGSTDCYGRRAAEAVPAERQEGR